MPHVLVALAMTALACVTTVATSAARHPSSGTVLGLLQSSLAPATVKESELPVGIAQNSTTATVRNLLLQSEVLLQQGLGLQALNAAAYAINSNSMNGRAWSAWARAHVQMGCVTAAHRDLFISQTVTHSSREPVQCATTRKETIGAPMRPLTHRHCHCHCTCAA